MLTYKDLLISGPEAICIADSEFMITEYNQNMSFLLNQKDADLKGRNLSSIFYDNSIIQGLAESDRRNFWYQGECMLKSNNDFPLLVKFRAGNIIEAESHEKIYIIAFKEIEEPQKIAYSRRIDALKLLLNFTLNHNHDTENLLTEFIKIFDKKAKAYLLNPQLYNQNISDADKGFISSKQVIMSIQIAIENKRAVIFQSDNPVCFFPVYSQQNLYGVAYIRFSMPCLYNDEDILLFALCGKTLGMVIESNMMIDYSDSLNPIFYSIFNKTKNSIVLVNSQGLITMINDATKTLFGFDRTEMIGRYLGNLVFPEESPHTYKSIIETINEGNSVQDIELELLKSNLAMINTVLTAYPYKKSDGTINGAIFIIQDNDDRKRLRDKMTQWEKLTVLGELLHSAANELNNSLTSVIGHSEILIQTENDDKISDISSKIHKGAIRCGNVVKGLIDLAKEDKMGYTSLDSVIRSALDLKFYQLKSNNIELYAELSENIPFMSIDLHKVERLILHLINYAEKRMIEYNNGGKLSIYVKLDETNIVIRLIDTGTCILETDMDNLFSFTLDNFFLDRDIDMIISCQILKSIGGTIHIDSHIESNNIITLKLPIIDNKPAELIGNYKNIANKRERSGKKILLVDDEVDIVDLLTEFLQENEYIVDIARDGNEAIEKVFNNNYDLIISDLRMPNGFTGNKLHSFVKRENPNLAKRMIFMTGDIINTETQSFLQNIGNPYLEKPFLPENLMEIINQMEG